MSHEPRECEHVLSSWTTVERTNAAGERLFVFRRYCCCPKCEYVEESSGAITEPAEPFTYAKTFKGGEEADD